MDKWKKSQSLRPGESSKFLAIDNAITNSSQAIEQIFALHFESAKSVLDLTFGQGGFWNWNWRALGLALTGADKLVPDKLDKDMDFVKYDLREGSPVAPRSFDLVVLDPPFAAMGPPSVKLGAKMPKRYGSLRSPDGVKSYRDIA